MTTPENTDRLLAKSWVQKAIPLIFYALLIIFLIFYLRSVDWDHLLHAKFILWPLLISACLEILSRYWGIGVWLVILKALGATGMRKNLAALMYAYSKAWLGRYIPGTAPWILGKIYFASKYGISKQRLAVASLMEGALEAGAVLALSLVVLLFSSKFSTIKGDLKWLVVGALAACVLVMTPKVFNFLLRLAYRILKRSKNYAGEYVGGNIISKGAVLYALGGIITGVSLFFVAKAFYPQLGFGSMLYVVSVGNLAAAIGMLAIFVPSGIGVREGIFLVLLSTIMPKEVALVVVVASRLWGVVMDLLFFVFNWLAKRRFSKSSLAS